MKILIYGAGVIGSLYAAYLHKAGYSVSMLARGARLDELKQNGLRYYVRGDIQHADINVIDKLWENDRYDYIFLTVREEQLRPALEQLRRNTSPTIVTMTNTIKPYNELEELCGKGRLLPAFPGAGGVFRDGILDAGFTPFIIQPTTFGEINGMYSERTKILENILSKVRIPHQIVKEMHAWQICHLAMVVPLADAYYMTKTPEKAAEDKNAMRLTAIQLHDNFVRLHKYGKLISPGKLNLFRVCPIGMLRKALTIIYKSKFGSRFMYTHAVKAEEEMNALHEEFYSYLNGS